MIFFMTFFVIFPFSHFYIFSFFQMKDDSDIISPDATAGRIPSLTNSLTLNDSGKWVISYFTYFNLCVRKRKFYFTARIVFFSYCSYSFRIFFSETGTLFVSFAFIYLYVHSYIYIYTIIYTIIYNCKTLHLSTIDNNEILLIFENWIIIPQEYLLILNIFFFQKL